MYMYLNTMQWHVSEERRGLGGPKRNNYFRLYREDIPFLLAAMYGEALQEEKVIGFRTYYPKV